MSDRLRKAIEAADGALLPFLTAGYPARDLTGDLLKAAAKGGATAIELGLPFSDSLADGPVVQASYHQAIEGGMTVARALDQLKEVSPDLPCPVLLMGSLNPMMRMGLVKFVARAAEAGAAGVLVPDLPPEDATEFRALLKAHGMAAIPLAAPTTPSARYRTLTRGAGGFLYQITRLGLTGARGGSLPKDLPRMVASARAASQLPVCLGFGISTPAQVTQAWRVADGAVVGSALLRKLEGANSVRTLTRRTREFVAELVAATRPRKSKPKQKIKRPSGGRKSS